jgi:hypothetical protein
MLAIEALLLVIIILLVWYYSKYQPSATGATPAVTVDTYIPGRDYAVMRAQPTPEQRAMAENSAYYGATEHAVGGPSDVEQTTGEYGGSGTSFTDIIASEAVDVQTMRNHAEFVKDRLSSNTQNITGRTFTLGEIESSDQVPWIGIRGRPQAIPSSSLGNPQQVPDVDPKNFVKKARFTFNSDA